MIFWPYQEIENLCKSVKKGLAFAFSFTKMLTDAVDMVETGSAYSYQRPPIHQCL